MAWRVSITRAPAKPPDFPTQGYGVSATGRIVAAAPKGFILDFSDTWDITEPGAFTADFTEPWDA